MRCTQIILFALVVTQVACGDSSTASPDAAPQSADASTTDAAPPPTEFGGDRPVTLQIPSSYSAATPTPLVVALHGFFKSPDYITLLMGIADWYEKNGFLFIQPSGLSDSDGNYYWNATEACCDHYDTGSDDVAYLAGLITDISAHYNVDAKRVYLIGHSNGGFMAYQMACEHADKIAAVISFAGAGAVMPSDCTPSEPVSIAQLHGVNDQTILYEGGVVIQSGTGLGVAYPSAATTVANWAAANGCDSKAGASGNIDLTSAPDSETVVTTHANCPQGIETSLWTMPGTGHIVGFGDQGRAKFWSWFQAHAKQ